MECRNLDVTVVSADDLKKVNLIGKMHTYAVVWVDPYYRQSTNVDKSGGAKPAWNQKLSFPVPEHFFQQPNANLSVEIFSKGSISDDKSVGVVVIPLSEISQKTDQEEVSTYHVTRRSGKVKGSLRLSVRVGEKMTMAAPAGMGAPSVPVAAYPPMYDQNREQLGAAPYGYPPAGAAAAAPYGYPPAGAAAAAPYGYPPAPQYPQPYGSYGGQGYYPPTGAPPQYYNTQPPKRPGLGGGMGMGLGAGLLAGAVGGLIVGEVVDDAFDGGFDGGCDF